MFNVVVQPLSSYLVDLDKRQGQQLKEHFLRSTKPNELEVETSYAGTESVVDVNGQRVRKGKERPLWIVGDLDVELTEGLVSLIDGALPKVTICMQVTIPPAGEGIGQRGDNNSAKLIKKSAARVRGGGDTGSA